MLLTGLAASSLLRLASASTATTADPSSESRVNLSRFEVTTTQDTGYVANNAVSGFKTNQSLMKIPQSISVLTRDLIDDVGAVNTSDLLQFAGASQFFRGESVRLRGARTLNPYLDDAIDNVPFSDNANIDSYEIIRGPAGVLYANSGVAGVVLKTSKKPLPFTQNIVNFSIKDYGLYRTELDSTGPLGKIGDAKMSYRFVGAVQDGDAYFKNLEDKRLAVHPSLQLDLNNTTARFAFDYIDRTTSSNAMNFVLSDGTLYTGAGRREGYFARDGMEGHKQVRQRMALLHRFSSNWESKLNVTHIEYTRQGSVLLPNNLNLRTQQVGFRSRRNYQKYDNWVLTHDFLGNYKIASFENQSAFGYTLTDEITRAAFTNSTTFGFPTVPIANPMMNNLVLQPYDTYQPVSTTGSWTNNRRSTYYYQHQLDLLPDRLILVGGLSYAALQTSDVPAVGLRNSVGGTRLVSFEDTLHRYGVVFNLTKDVALYVLDSTTFAPQSNSNTRDINGVLLPAQNGKGREVGLKTALFGGKLSTTVSFFDLQLSNVGILVAIPSPVTGQSYFLPIGQQIQKGWDATISYAPTPEWQIIANGYSGTVKDQTGATVDNTYRNLYSFFTRYAFRDGMLKGVSLGGGASKTGGNIFTIINSYIAADGTIPTSITLESVWNVTFFASYKYNKHWSFRVNVENVLDKAFALGAQHPRLVDPSPPRTFQFSTSYKF
ncbi:MAG: TonB-dependent receptor [Bryobacteraceae bacterium]|nr:TonB-dependent receptor [Bryobacteraceae bacterium]